MKKILFFFICCIPYGCVIQKVSVLDKKACCCNENKEIFAFEVIDTLFALPIPFLKKIFVSGYVIKADTDGDGILDTQIEFDRERFGELQTRKQKKELPCLVELDARPKKGAKIEQRCLYDAVSFPKKDNSESSRKSKKKVKAKKSLESRFKSSKRDFLFRQARSM